MSSRRPRPLLLALAATLAATAAAAPAALADGSVKAGPLTASWTDDPFSLRFTDRRGGEVLRTLGETPEPTSVRGRYGPLGYSFDLRLPLVNNAFFGYYVAAEVETVWFHATEIRRSQSQGRATRLIAETNDPLGHELEITITPLRSGIVRVASRILPGSGPLAGMATISGGAFEAAAGERFLGFGERSNASDQTGNEVFNWAEEGPFSSGIGEDVLRPLIPDFTFPTGPTATNFPVPWQLSSRGFGFLIDQDERSRFRPASERRSAWQAEAESSRFRFTVFAGPRPADALRRYSGWVGRQPRPAPWIFGPWFQPTGERERFELAKRFREDGVPVTVAQTYTHYLPCGAHVGREDSQRQLTRGYHHLGYKVTTYFNPHICTTYDPVYGEAARRGLFVRGPGGDPYILSNPFTADEQVSELDFTNPEANRFFHRLLDEAIDAGYDGWMEDFGEYTPTNSYFANGKDGLEMHNRYPVIYHRASTVHTKRRMGRDAAVFVRSGWHGVQPYARVVWGGDPTEDWSCADGLCAALNQALSIGMSGIAYWGSDIGGFHAVANGRTSDELNIRWLELGAFSGVMRTQANGYSFFDNRDDRSQVWKEAVYPVWSRYARLRTQLLPYIEAVSARYQRTGMPITRHMILQYPGDPQAVRAGDQMMFGDELLVAPVIEEGATSRRVYLPRGKWIELWRSARYRPARGTFQLHRPAVLTGSRAVEVRAPLDEIPIFVRAGAVIAMLHPGVDTLANVGSRKGLVTLTDARKRLRLVAFPRGRSRSAFGSHGRLRSVAGPSRWKLEISDRERRRYRIEAALGTAAKPLRPCRVEFSGKRVPKDHWKHWRRSSYLQVDVTGRGGTLIVEGCR